MATKSSDGNVEKYTPFLHAKLCKNSEIIDEILIMAGNEKILEDIFNESKQPLLQDVEQETAIGENFPILPYIDEDPEESLEVKEHTNTEASTTLHKHVDKDINISQPVAENREEVQNSSINTVEPIPELVVKNRAQDPSIKTTIKPIHIPQPLAEDKEESQNDSIEITIEPPSVDSKTSEQEQNIPDSPSTTDIEPYFDNESGTDSSEGETSSKKLSKSIIAGIVGVVVLVNCVALYIMKMPVAAATLGIAGLHRFCVV